MALGYLVGSIAGVTLEGPGGAPLRALLIGGGNLMGARAVNNRMSAAGTLYTQSMTLGAGIPFQIKLEFCPLDVLADIVAAIRAAVDAQSSFSVSVQNDIQTVDVDAVPAAGNWLEIAEQRTNETTAKGIVLNLLTA
jgi:hypothetical protein